MSLQFLALTHYQVFPWDDVGTDVKSERNAEQQEGTRKTA